MNARPVLTLCPLFCLSNVQSKPSLPSSLSALRQHWATQPLEHFYSIKQERSFALLRLLSEEIPYIRGGQRCHWQLLHRHFLLGSGRPASVYSTDSRLK